MVRWPVVTVLAGIVSFSAPGAGAAALEPDEWSTPGPCDIEPRRKRFPAFPADGLADSSRSQPSLVDSGGAARDTPSTADSLAVTNGPDTLRAGRPSDGGRGAPSSGLKVVGGIALFELTAAAYSGIASDSPVGAGVLASIASPLVYGLVHSDQPASVALVPAVAVGTLGIFNFVLSAGNHSDDDLFTYNMIACNVVGGAAFLIHRIQTGKHHASGGGASTSPPAWSVGFGTAGGAAALHITRRF